MLYVFERNFTQNVFPAKMRRLQFMKQLFFFFCLVQYIFLGGLECVGHSFAYVAHFDVWIRFWYCTASFLYKMLLNCLLYCNNKYKNQHFYANVAIAFFCYFVHKRTASEFDKAPLLWGILLHFYFPASASHRCFLDSAVPCSIFNFVFSHDFARSSLRASNL
jgi:hypothetical protein